MTVRFNVEKGWPDSRGSAIDETYTIAAAATIAEGNIVTLGGTVGSPTVDLADASDLDIGAAVAADPTEAEIQAVFDLLDAEPLFLAIEGNDTGNLSGAWLNKAVVLIGGGMKFSLPTALYNLNGGVAATVFAPGSAVTVDSGLISARNNGTADFSHREVFGWVEDYSASTGLLTVIRK